MIKNFRNIIDKLQNFDNPEICPIVSNYVPAMNCDTIFKYILDDKGRKTADIGLNNFY